ncbi:MAG: 1,4-beta-xylanase [Candidatus Binatia bacterium]
MTAQETRRPSRDRWTVQQAQAWWERQPWFVGCNFIPSSAVNQLEMWQAETCDPATVERELAWAADLGFDIVRVYLHDLVWAEDRDGFLERIDAFLGSAHGNRIKVALVIFDDVWNPEPKTGPQPAPYPGRHNSRWVQSPGLAALAAYPTDRSLRKRLEHYVKGIVGAFAGDNRIAFWDLYNEPGGYPSPLAEPVGAACLPLLRDVFDWARAAVPTQPLTSGLWWSPVHPVPDAIQATQLEQSDVVSFHHYGISEELEKLSGRLGAVTERPLICTEYLARDLQSRFETHLPIFRERRIGAISWGLVSGKTQTIYPWWSWFDKEPKPEPQVWFHDVLRPDGTPFDQAEADFLRTLLRGPRKLS